MYTLLNICRKIHTLVVFMSFLSLFTFFMFILVTGGNFVQLFVGWEGVGLCSYLLINFWYTRINANVAAIKAILVNRVGDFGIMFALVLLFLLPWYVGFCGIIFNCRLLLFFEN